ncbi:MAG TPA: hypothetical protein VM677_26070 [Actinokineospora sp.]|nr:hypothetical protein [Actinokineospora sp.]
MIRSWVTAVCAATMLSACTASVEVTSPEAPTTATESIPTTRAVDPARVTAEAAFGDLVAVDLCEFLKPEDLREFGETRIGSPGGFDSCVVEVALPDNTRARVYAGSFFDVLDEPSRAPSRTLAGGVRIYDGAGGECRTDIFFPDDVGLAVWAVMPTPPTIDLCPLVHRAVEAMGNRFPTGIVSTRNIASNSLAKVDACAALPADLAGFDPTRESGRAKHSCGSPSGDATTPHVSLTLAAGYAPVADLRTDTATIDGRPTIIHKFPLVTNEGLKYCAASAAHIPIEINDLPGATEYAVVEVWLATDDKCATAKAIAEQVWPKLPR